MLADVNKKLIFAKRMFKDKRWQRAKQKKEIKNLKFIIFLDLGNNKFILLVYNKLNSFLQFYVISKCLLFQKIGCKTYFYILIRQIFAVSLPTLTKQHNLFYTLKN